MENKQKFYLKCKKCGHRIDTFQEWFTVKQHCPKCACPQADVIYLESMENLRELVADKNATLKNVWHYFKFLPLLNSENVVSFGGEGVVPINHWEFLEEYAKQRYNIHIKVYAHRNDLHRATGTFKDLAGTVVASVLKENNVKQYVAASTGNIGTAYSCYLAKAGISATVFIPDSSIKAQESEISSFGQTVVRTKGDYAFAKTVAKNFADKHNIILTGGNFDPMRIEAKKTMVYEWLRVLPEFPTVFLQAISGGSGPLGIAKASAELEGLGFFSKMPRFILPQPHRCAPMVEAWEKAKSEKFPEGWENNYPVYDNPQTTIRTLATGNPTAYPALAPVVKLSGGEIISCVEEKTFDVTRYIAYKCGVRIGPAAAITVVGFFQALREKQIVDGDVVMLNIGEGVGRSPEYVEQLAYTSQTVDNVDDCKLIDRKIYEQQLLKEIDSI